MAMQDVRWLHGGCVDKLPVITLDEDRLFLKRAVRDSLPDSPSLPLLKAALDRRG